MCVSLHLCADGSSPFHLIKCSSLCPSSITPSGRSLINRGSCFKMIRSLHPQTLCLYTHTHTHSQAHKHMTWNVITVSFEGILANAVGGPSCSTYTLFPFLITHTHTSSNSMLVSSAHIHKCSHTHTRSFHGDG